MIVNQYPKWWQASPETLAIWQAEDTEAAALRAHWRDILDQCNVETATWGLALWERQLDLPTDSGLPDDLRRSKILAKLRGVGTVTPAMIRAVAESFSEYPVELEEQPRAYHFTIRYIGVPDIDHPQGLIDSINQLKPAHLTFGIAHRVIQPRAVSVAAVSRQGDVYRSAPLICKGHRQRPVHVGLVPRQGDLYITRQVF